MITRITPLIDYNHQNLVEDQQDDSIKTIFSLHSTGFFGLYIINPYSMQFCTQRRNIVLPLFTSFASSQALIGLLLPALLIPFWVIRIKEDAKKADLITYKTHQELWSVVQNTTNALLPMSSSATNLAKLAAVSVNKTRLTFSDIETKVAPLMFQALLMVPQLSQISYIEKDGLFFAIYSQGPQQIFAIYSNTSFTNATTSGKNYLWYTQPVDYDTGKLRGESVAFAPQILVNESWVQQALNTTNKNIASLGKSLNEVNKTLVLNTAGVDDNGVVSLGFDLKSFIDVLSGIKLFDGGLYLLTKDGDILSNTIPNTRVVYDGNATIYFKILKDNGKRIDDDRNVTLKLNNEATESYVLDISGTKYILYYSSINIIGMQSVFVLAIPYDGLHGKMNKDTIYVFAFLVLIFVTITISIFAFVVLIVRAERKQMCLKASLVKQMEATQQAERKRNNQNRAFVSASHDIRASLAGITGFLDMSINEVHQESELAKNLRSVQSCSEYLHSILNSILDTSKIEAGKMSLEEKQFDLVKVIEGVVDLFYPVGLKKDVDVILDLKDGSLNNFSQVIGDERRLKQILSNLLSNAIKFTSEGYVSVRVRAMKPRLQNSTFASKHESSARCLSRFFFKNDEKGGNFEMIDEIRHDPNSMEFVFEVNDTGKGIPKEKQASVFEHYVQVKETAPEIEGTGLGLWIVQSMVRLMGGEISIVDKKPHENGTCFRFNVVLKVSSCDLRGISEDEKSNLSSRSTTPLCSPQHKDYNSSTVVLFISGDERRKMIHKFLQARRINVLTAKNMQQLSETLGKFRQEKSKTGYSRSDVNLSFEYLSRPISQESVPLSEFDVPRANDVSGSSFVLLVIDTTRVNFRELCKVVAEFRKHSKCVSFRVVWLGFKCMQVHGLDEKQLPPSDIIIPMPLQGSRLNSLIHLLPEFGGRFPCMPPRVTNHDRSPKRQDEIQEITRNSPSNKSPLRGKKMLLVEDDSLQQMIAKKSLLKLGVVIDTCTNGEEALTLVNKGLDDQRDLGASHILPYEYILMDCQMPVMDGCEATRRIRETERDYGVHIPIIGLTAHGEGEELNKFFAAGIDINVSKPLNEQKLIIAIEDLYSRCSC
ncbi:histidine kinase CKI1-like [Rutidosis leptorrhynchoides]|uniref:histidine kinase CKI1-like n=1 Tax=Rutidosis leptorrhynchoides TaxID=125765 RepID=UPI003A99FA9C